MVLVTLFHTSYTALLSKVNDDDDDDDDDNDDDDNNDDYGGGGNGDYDI